jgi:hypothetical protein
MHYKATFPILASTDLTLTRPNPHQTWPSPDLTLTRPDPHQTWPPPDLTLTRLILTRSGPKQTWPSPDLNLNLTWPSTSPHLTLKMTSPDLTLTRPNHHQTWPSLQCRPDLQRNQLSFGISLLKVSLVTNPMKDWQKKTSFSPSDDISHYQLPPGEGRGYFPIHIYTLAYKRAHFLRPHVVLPQQCIEKSIPLARASRYSVCPVVMN